MNSIELLWKDTIFNNSGLLLRLLKRLLLNHSDKIKLKWSDKYVALSYLCIQYRLKNVKHSY